MTFMSSEPGLNEYVITDISTPLMFLIIGEKL